MTASAPASVDELISSVSGSLGPSYTLSVTSAFWLHHTTRLPGAEVTYRNYYVLLRVGEVFGASSFESVELDPSYCADTSGRTRLPTYCSPMTHYRCGSRHWTRTWPPSSRTTRIT